MSIFDDVQSMNLEYLWKHDPRKFAQCVQRLTEQVMETVRPEKRASLQDFHTRISKILSQCKNDNMVRGKMMELVKDNALAQLGALSKLQEILSQFKGGALDYGPGSQKSEE